jgi:hypothetical protein
MSNINCGDCVNHSGCVDQCARKVRHAPLIPGEQVGYLSADTGAGGSWAASQLVPDPSVVWSVEEDREDGMEMMIPVEAYARLVAKTRRFDDHLRHCTLGCDHAL